MRSLFEIISEEGSFSAFRAAIKIAHLECLFHSERSLTVFVPLDRAFAKLPPECFDHLLASPDHLSRLLARHIVPERLTLGDIKGRSALSPCGGGALKVTSKPHLKINGAKVGESGILASNGLLYPVDLLFMSPRYNGAVWNLSLPASAPGRLRSS